MDFSENRKLRMEYLELYYKAFEFYRNEGMNIKEIELEQSRLRNKATKYSNPAFSTLSAMIVLIFSLISNLFTAIFYPEYGFWLTFTIYSIFVGVCFMLCSTLNKQTDDMNKYIDYYSAAIIALEDLKSDIYDNKSIC